MGIRNLIRTIIREDNQLILEGWFHGSPDVREVEKVGGFTNMKMVVDYVVDPNLYKDIQQRMKDARKTGNEDLYWKLLDEVPKLKKNYTYRKPLFLTDKFLVAKTYAVPKRAFDYQNAVEKVYEVDVDCNNVVKIMAIGKQFRFIGVDKVKSGFMSAGISENEIDKLINMFNYYIPDNKGVKTDVIAAIGNWLGFDCIDVIGVLDSYEGGSIKSTVRMVLDPTKVRIKKQL